MDNDVIDLLRGVAHAFQSRMQMEILAHGAGITAFQGRLINLIGRSEGVSQLTLASWTDRDKAQVARAVKELENRNLVLRSAHASDWRLKCLSLTAEGQQIHAELNDLRARLASVALDMLTSEEKNALRLGLGKMREALDRSA